ncbi:aminotransferase class V-fold PLP-dependent enzyme [Nocardia cyriacigeorgica]|jgi:selenocysteine lyase/cysteine desulfurase|uniref:aminotransferase class V-fold PLP-dependent enzyme n=3 Tax=Nocardia cyriacigeorgica TaxID=135487 RepID=UPI0003173293|nr:aminotransferase class V-fold PLP-dependent enzyme [Nocardia cyriacigeorgica]AVH21165.1 aminotransferase class V-fold PLP-dependent enzyme [Nocardia cyriacigeorgica]PPJ07590.1 aminotransferase class V-fold PLP-dependent enzyme [Nocardia cyriacigeorgica]TLF58324.1 aminotransferase class V-fold PLP-dependent enzyme [Nocardia cyriacigeorgica]
MTAVFDQTCAALARVSGDDLRVPLVQGGTCTYTNFDYAASAPALAQVTDRVQRLLPYYASVHRGAGYASRISTECYETARGSVARFLDATDDQVVVFTRNTTDSLNLLASCVPGDTVVLDVEHHANFLPWQRRGRRVVTAADTVEETIRRIVAELCAKPAALLAVTGASNVTGEVLPLARLAEIAHQCGARILVDAAQLAPHRRISLRECGIDYLAFSGHKLYAPFGAGVLVGKRDWLDAAPAYLAGGGAVREVRVNGTEWAPAPQRHEAGSPNVLGVAALAAACDALTEIDADRVLAHERRLAERLRAGLCAIPGVRLLRLWSDSPDTVGIVAFTLDGFAPGQVAAYLSAEHGIGVRDGRFCAHPLLARLGLDGALRASIGLGTSSADVDRLVSAVATLVHDGPGWDYTRTDGLWNPTPETRSFTGADIAGASPCEIG